MFKQDLHQVLLISSGAKGRSEKHSPIAMCPTANTNGILATLPWSKWRAQTLRGTASVVYGKSEQHNDRKSVLGELVYLIGKVSLRGRKNRGCERAQQLYRLLTPAFEQGNWTSSTIPNAENSSEKTMDDSTCQVMVSTESSFLQRHGHLPQLNSLLHYPNFRVSCPWHKPIQARSTFTLYFWLVFKYLHHQSGLSFPGTSWLPHLLPAFGCYK